MIGERRDLELDELVGRSTFLQKFVRLFVQTRVSVSSVASFSNVHTYVYTGRHVDYASVIYNARAISGSCMQNRYVFESTKFFGRHVFDILQICKW